MDGGSSAPNTAPPPSSVITNGAVSGVLPESTAFAINYPGYPSSPTRAIDTLGGLDEIAKVRSSDSKQLELRFRPEDPYCHPASGERRPFAGLLLKLSKTRPESNNGSGEQLSAEIVARVNEAYHFEGMTDYQYVLAVHAAEARRNKRPRSLDEETDLEKEADVMMLVPPLFSIKNIPEEIVLNPPPNLFSKNLQRSVVEHRWEMDIEPCLALDFKIERVPDKVNWEDHVGRDTADWELQMAVSKLFEERPIWPRQSINEELLDAGLHVSTHVLKRLLFRSGYYFSKGAFAKFWVRKGYDPRKDPESWRFQRIDFRVPLQLRDLSDANKEASGFQRKWKSICQFQVFPWKTFTSLQFFELADDFIQEEIQKPTDQATCSQCSRGWLSEVRYKMLRLRVAIRFLSICEKEGAKILLKSFCEEFEKCKKLEAYRRNRKAVNENEYASLGSKSTGTVCATGTEHQLLGQDEQVISDAANQEEEEEEDEEEEEEVDAYQSPTVAPGDGFFGPEACSSDQSADNITSDYLQDLLSEIPCGEAGKDPMLNEEFLEANLSDGEYQIYEQDSDAFDDDDDDDDDDHDDDFS